ncbi:unnamed protein product [Caenorhabditis nigoni]
MGRKKGKKQQRQNQTMASPSSAAPGFQDLGSPSLVEVKSSSNFGDEVVIPPNNDDNSFNQNIYKMAYLSGDDVNLERKNSSRGGSNSSSYHDLIDGGAYDRFRHGAGDRVIAGSRSISHRSLFNEDRSLNRSLNPSKTSLAGSIQGSKVSMEWDDMGNERSSGRQSIVIGDDGARKPFVRSRTVSSGGSIRNSQSHNNNNNNLLPPLSGTLSHRDISSADVRTFHADSDYLQNHLSKLSIHSNNDEFVLVGGHPPPISTSTTSLNQGVPVPRARSRISSYSENVEDQDLGRSVSQQSLTRASSRFSVGTNGTNSNTDDRLILAERYSRSPEAEGLLFQQNSSRPSSRLSTTSSDRGVGFVEIPTLYSHPDERFDDGEDEEPGEPFRPTSEHSSTPTGAPRARKTLLRNAETEDVADGRNRRFSSSSSSVSRHDTPSTPLLVTSALTPVIPKRHPQMSASHSEDSLVMKTPQTVQRGNSEQKSLRSNLETIKKTVEIAVQTGNSIRLRQNQHFGDVLSECAYLPDPRGFEMTPTITTSFVPQDEEVFVPKNGPEVKNPSQNSIRARLRHISDIYSTEDSKDSREKETPILTQNYVQIPKNTTSQPVQPARKATQEIVVPINKVLAPKPDSGRVVEIPKTQELNGDTIRKHIPRGRIRDLASAFDKMNDGPVRPLEFKSQVHIPTAIPIATPTPREETLWNSRKPSGASRESDVNRADSRMSGPLSGPLNGSSSSAFRSSTQTIRSQEDRRRSTSSSLHHQPHVFTRNTFLTSSVAKPVVLPENVPMSTTYSRENISGGFVSAFDKASSIEIDRESPLHKTLSNKNLAKSPTKDSTFSEYSRKIDVPVRLEVPINKSRRQLLSNNPRAKTQEIPTFEFESRYESRAVSGDLNNENPSVFGMQKPLFAASREAFGRDTAEDLRGKQDNWPLRPQQQHQWTSEFHMNETRNTNSVSSPMYHHTNDHITQSHQQPTTTITEFRINHKQQQPEMLRSVQKPSAHHRPSISSARHPYSPPATEDAGSRITHHTSQTLQSEDLFATEDSSIRGKIDRMFDFVESDDSRKTLRGATHDSTDTLGTNTNKFHRTESRLLSKEIPEALKASPPKMKSPERRNTVTVPEHFDTDLEYSLSQYREMQREQLRRRLPSADEPQFFRSPTLSAPHAGQSMHAYRSKDIMGTPTAGEKFRFPSSSNRAPLATSTPVESPSGRSYSKSYLEMNNNNTTVPPNETFVSSISGVSAVDKHVDVMRKINRLSYMIENTQKQMSMNEAALMDAVKKGRRSQEISAHRSILISRETLRLQRNELRRLHAFSAVRRPPPPVAKELRGSVIFKNLIVHLNKLFVSRLTTKDDNSYSFVALFKFGHQIEATELVPLRVYQGEETDDKLFFVKQIQFSDVPVDFMVTIEIYAMRVPSAKPVELSIGSSLANKCKSLMGPPQKKNPIALETAFKFRGRLVLDRDAAGERCLYLDDVTYPLEGTVMITTQCSRLPESFEIDFRGFLTMFHTISNMASWERYWAVLRRGVVLFWKYPDDEQNGREPKMQIDLTKCTNNSIEKCSADLCPRPESFVIEILVDAEDGTIGSVVEKKRVLLSADTSEMLSQWLFTLNQTLDVIRGPI